MLKKITPLLLLAISPIVAFSTSCSNNNYYEEINNVNSLVLNYANLTPKISFTKTKEQIKITDFVKNEFTTFNWTASNLDVIENGEINQEKTKNRKDEFNKLLSKVNIEFSHYFFPIFGNDKESYLVFRVSSKKNHDIHDFIRVKISDIVQYNTMETKFANLTIEELNADISKKSNENYLSSNLRVAINNIISDSLDPNEILNTNAQNASFLSQKFHYSIKNQILKNVNNFNDVEYVNIYIDNTSYKITKNELEGSYSFDFNISTSKQNDPNNYHSMKVNFNYEATK